MNFNLASSLRLFRSVRGLAGLSLVLLLMSSCVASLSTINNDRRTVGAIRFTASTGSNSSDASSVSVGINIDPKNPKGFPSVANLTDLGAAGVRIEYKDVSGGSPHPDPASLQLYRNAAQRYCDDGIFVLMILDYSMLPGFPSPTGSNSEWDAYIQNFAARAAAVASYMGSCVTAYEIWNEPDLSPQPGYNVYVPPARYSCLLAAAYKSVKSVASHATIVLGGLASGSPPYVSQVAAASCGLHADAVGVHPYGRRPFPDWPSSTWGFGVITDLMASYYAVSKMPLWITEVGTNVLSVQGEFPEKTFQAIQQDESKVPVPVVMWFCWSDAMVNPFGVVNVDGQPKPAFASYQAFAKQG